MKKSLLILLVLSCTLFACNNNRSEVTQEKTAGPVAMPVYFDYAKLEGMYSGDFGNSGDIRLILRHITGSHAVGYSLHKGLRRNFSGSMRSGNGGFAFELNEPGDNKYDGVFYFTIDTNSLVLKGSWKPVNPESTPAKTYELTRNWKDTVEEYYGEMYGDSLGDINFQKNGLVTYQYYPKTVNAQLQQFNGNWTLKDSTYYIEWQPNTVFPSRKLKLNIIRLHESDEDYDGYNQHLEGEGRIFNRSEGE